MAAEARKTSDVFIDSPGTCVQMSVLGVAIMEEISDVSVRWAADAPGDSPRQHRGLLTGECGKGVVLEGVELRQDGEPGRLREGRQDRWQRRQSREAGEPRFPAGVVPR